MAYGVNAPFGLRPISSINGGSWTEKTNEYYISASADGATTYLKNIFTGDPVVWITQKNYYGTIAVYNPDFQDNDPSTFSDQSILGVFQGCEYTDTTGKLVQSAYWPGGTNVLAGTKIKAFIIDDPNVVYDIQVSVHKNAVDNAFISSPNFPAASDVDERAGSFGGNFALNIGGGTNFNTITLNGGPANENNPFIGYANNPASGDTRTGQSAFYLEASTSNDLNTGTNDYNKASIDSIDLPLKAIGYTLDPRNVAGKNYNGEPLTMDTTPFLNVRVLINNHVYRQTEGTTFE